MRPLLCGLSLVLLASCGGDDSAPPAPGNDASATPTPVYEMTAVSSPIHIDRIYRSMAGPLRNSTLVLQEGPPEILWLTAYRTEVLGAEGEEATSGEFMCHTNMVYDGAAHAARFGSTRSRPYNRLFTTSQGQFEVELPEGFGIPVLSNETLGLNTQALNHNLPEADLDVRFRITLEFVRDADARGSLKPLFPTLAYVMALVDGEHGVYGVDDPSHLQSDASCMPGDVAPQAVDRKGIIEDGLGRKFTGHWVVPPGREVRRTLVNEILDLPFDTTAHYIGVHLHPFAESLELRDLTTDETVFRSQARGTETGIGLVHADHYASGEGLKLYRDHDYEMVSVYENTSGVDQDAMATFFIYLHDKDAAGLLDSLRAQL